MDISRFVDIETNRLEVFNLFTSFLCEPEPSIMQNNLYYKKLANNLGSLLPGNTLNTNLLAKILAETDFQKFEVEFARLFIGPFKVPAPPYSSLYLGEETVMGKSTQWVEKFYLKAGLEFDPDIKDLPDHAAVETEFMYYLIYNEINTLNQELNVESKRFWELQKIFFEKHYKVWMPKFCDNVIEYTEMDYFKIIFQALKDLVTKVECPEFPQTTN